MFFRFFFSGTLWRHISELPEIADSLEIFTRNWKCVHLDNVDSPRKKMEEGQLLFS